MAVRVLVRIESLCGRTPGAVLETSGMANTGFEAEREDISLPLGAASRLGLWPPPPGARKRTVLAYGVMVDIQEIPDAARVRVLTPDRQGPEVVCQATLTDTDDEVVLSDALTQGLAIDPFRPKDGFWRFSDEALAVSRPSVPAQTW
ncbi:MAG: hypothetical protein HY720_16400 [Planctomycetes bacterium]|nr:hypothetical protein [Planctomycetota bacterium]